MKTLDNIEVDRRGREWRNSTCVGCGSEIQEEDVCAAIECDCPNCLFPSLLCMACVGIIYKRMIEID